HLAAASVEPTTPVTINLCDRIPLRTALFLVLRPLGLEQVPSHKGGLRVVVIGSIGEDTIVYHVEDVVASDAELEKLLSLVETRVAPQTWRDAGGSGVMARLRDPKFAFVVHNEAHVCGQVADLLLQVRRIREQRAPQAQPQ